MVLFVVYAFTVAIYVQATGTSSEVNNASIAFVDEDESALSKELIQRLLSAALPVPRDDHAPPRSKTRWTEAGSCSSS